MTLHRSKSPRATSAHFECFYVQSEFLSNGPDFVGRNYQLRGEQVRLRNLASGFKCQAEE